MRISGVSIKNSHFWNVHFWKCRRVRVDRVRIEAPGPRTPPAAPSPDAIDFDAVTDAVVRDSHLDVNDDAICLKGGKNYGCEKLPENGGNMNILVERCTFGPACHAAFTCGSEAFLCRNIVVRDCEVQGCYKLLHLKARPDTRQRYEDILVENATGRCRNVFVMRPWTQWFTLPEGVGKQETSARNVVFRNCKVKGGKVVDIDDEWMRIDDLRFENCDFD